ncbi:MAG TPA: hypothetical protein VEW48_11270 [Thermoanaerobaculia bacterium]|nr:hypothetical protein [Thermoanaerobaculia bacterium]
MDKLANLSLMIAFADPTAWLPYAFYVATLFSLIGLALALMGAKSRAASAESMGRFGANLFIGGTLAQIAAGVWFSFVLPVEVREGFLGGNAGDTALLRGAAAAAVLAVLIARRNPVLATAAFLVTLTGMAIVRQREQMLVVDYFRDTPAIAPQTVSFLVFAVLFVVGLAAVGWRIWKGYMTQALSHS